jgi:cytochrome c556
MALTLVTLAGAAAAALAAEPVEIVKYRQAMMKANGAHMTATASIIFGKVDYKSELGDHVKALQAINRNLTALFPEGSNVGETAAIPAIWMDKDEFKKHAAIAAQKSEALAKAVAAGDTKSYPARFSELGDACKSCHKEFRMESK